MRITQMTFLGERGMRSRGERGIVLGIVLITSIIFGIVAFGLLSLATNQSRQGSFISEERVRARYAAEAGLVYAMQRLWVNPDECAAAALSPPPFDTGDGIVMTIVVTRTPCASNSTLSSKVTF